MAYSIAAAQRIIICPCEHESDTEVDNCVLLGGVITQVSETRYSPAGIPITRLVLDHRSAQHEAGLPREARCQLPVLLCGQTFQPLLQTLIPGHSVRVRGFLARANHRRGEARVVLHATAIEPLRT